MLQLVLLNILPHNLAKAYYMQKMLQWRINKVKKFENSMFLTHSILVFFSCLVGFIALRAGGLMNAVPGAGFFAQMALIILYFYLSFWSMIGFFTTILLTIWLVMWLVRCP